MKEVSIIKAFLKKRISGLLAVLMVFAALYAGQPAASAATYEKIMFPMKYLRVTNTEHDPETAIDLGGGYSSDGKHYEDVYAPFTGRITHIEPEWNAVWFESKSEVDFADDSRGYCTLIFIHDNDISDLYKGKEIKQGVRFYQEGGKGPDGTNDFSTHVHIECIKGKINNPGLTAKRGEITADKVFFYTSDTVIKNAGDFKWVNYLGKTSITSSASSGYNSIKIEWSELKNATGYEIWRSDGGKYKKINEVKDALLYIDTGLTFGQKYSYKVRGTGSVESSTVFGSYSDAKSAEPGPAAPSGVKLSNVKSIEISWDAVDGATKYEVYYASSENGKYKLIRTTANLSLTFAPLKGKEYFYKVRAYGIVSGKRVYGEYSARVSGARAA